MNIGGFFEMGGYAAFVWPSYGAAAALLLAFAIAGVRALRRQEGRLAEYERGRTKRKDIA